MVQLHERITHYKIYTAKIKNCTNFELFYFEKGLKSITNIETVITLTITNLTKEF